MIPSSLLTPIANHLWQSTVFVMVLTLIALLLKNNRAHVRSLVWLAASIKFLLPFSLLVAIGSQLPWTPTIVATPTELAFAVEQISQPFNGTRDGDATLMTAAATYSFNELLLTLIAPGGGPLGPGGGPGGPGGPGVAEHRNRSPDRRFSRPFKEILGLRLESTKGPVETIVVDSVARPSEN